MAIRRIRRLIDDPLQKLIESDWPRDLVAQPTAAVARVFPSPSSSRNNSPDSLTRFDSGSAGGGVVAGDYALLTRDSGMLCNLLLHSAVLGDPSAFP